MELAIISRYSQHPGPGEAAPRRRIFQFTQGVGTLGTNQKVWVIPSSGDQGRRNSQGNGTGALTENGSHSAGRTERSSMDRERRRPEPSRLLVLAAVFSYFLGPLSVLASRKGRKSRFWVFLAVLSLVSTGIFAAALAGGFDADESSVRLVPVWLGCGIAGVLFGSAAWSGGVLLAAKRYRKELGSLPAVFRKGSIAGVLGMIFPGFGLFLIRRRGRAASAVWAAGSVVISWIILYSAGWIWNWHNRPGPGAAGADSVEYLFLSAAVLMVVGIISWLFQALDGARLASPGGRNGSRARADLYIVALLVAAAAFGLTFQGEAAARYLDDNSSKMLKSGYRIIPLYLSRAAERIDPSRPEYRLRLMRIYGKLENREAEIAARADLVRRLIPCSDFIREEGLAGTNREPLSYGNTSLYHSAGPGEWVRWGDGLPPI